MIDGTSFDSADTHKEKIAGMLEAGSFRISGHLYSGDTNGQIAMIADQLSRTSRTFLITWPSAMAMTATGTGYISNFQPGDVTPDGKVEFEMEITPTGKVTIGATASGGLTGLTGIEENAGGALDFVPNFSNTLYEYNVLVNTASTYVKFTPTAASHTITITNSFDGSVTTVPTGNQSGELDLGAANSLTIFTIKCWESGKAIKQYVVNVARA
jgi:predicted secreted protein